MMSNITSNYTSTTTLPTTYLPLTTIVTFAPSPPTTLVISTTPTTLTTTTTQKPKEENYYCPFEYNYNIIKHHHLNDNKYTTRHNHHIAYSAFSK